MDEGASNSGNVNSSEIEEFILVTNDYRKARRKKYFAERDASKIYLFSEQFERWQKLKKELGIDTNKDLAALLIDTYYTNKQIVTHR